MDKLRVNSGIKTIEVNDAGECIQFSATDSSFFESFFELVNWLESDELKKLITELEGQEDSVESEDISTAQKSVKTYKGIIEQAMNKIDSIFGSDASKKIFCGITPDIYAIFDFFEQIMPYIEKYANERGRYISKKYSTKRKGAKS